MAFGSSMRDSKSGQIGIHFASEGHMNVFSNDLNPMIDVISIYWNMFEPTISHASALRPGEL